ncbi:hypothetical protein [Variovorax atrisoli]|uniref:hypothetical protein n=1 Tax=Variovorax atrisoli TaxID=3394203 RepID=UPI0012FE59C7|nr:hypothetical protein [Variovorax paradoxus]
MKKLTAALLILCCSSTMAIEIRGATSCGDWARSRQSANPAAGPNQLWMLAYLSGLASALHKDGLKGTSNASIFLIADEYCRKNPSDHLDDAGNEVFRELLKKNNL